MPLAEAAQKAVAEFEYSAEDVKAGVKEFLAEMGENSLQPICGTFADSFVSEEGLQKSGAMMSQIPTYVTAVPNGTEKVRRS